MQAFIGLTKKTIDEANNIKAALAELQAKPEEVCNDRELRLLRLVEHVESNPDINLWLNHHGYGFDSRLA